MQPTMFCTFSNQNTVFNHLQYTYMTDDSFSPHTHDTHELIYLKKGSVTYTIEGRSCHAESGDLIFTRPGHRHNIHFDDKSVYDRFAVLFDERIFSKPICRQIPKTIDIVHFAAHPITADIFKKLDYYCTRLDAESFGRVLKHLVEEILYNILLLSTEEAENVTATYTANPLVTQAISYIRRHPACTVEEICQSLHITDSYLHQLFGKHLGISPKKYILSGQLEKARRAIRGGKRPTEVFIEYGFREYCTFFRNYKKYFGHTPSEETTEEIIRKIQT